MKQDGSRALFQYWNRLRGTRTAPLRTEVEPADIKTLLGDTFILERDTRGEPIFRLAGTRLCAVYGRELKGFAFASLWRDRDRRMMSRLVSNVFQSKSVVVFDFEGFSREDRSTQFEFVLLPLDGGLESPRCLGALSVGTKPFWLGAEAVTDAKIGSVRFVEPDRDPFLVDRRRTPRLDSNDAIQIGRSSDAMPLNNARRIRHLLVLEGGREP
jgi:hypothetical protein